MDAGTDLDALSRCRDLIRRGHWAEADRHAIDDGLVYAPTMVQHSDDVPGRASARSGLVLANSGVDRTGALELVGQALDESNRRDPETFWHGALILLYAEELQRAEDECAATPWGRTAWLTALRARIWALSGELRRAREALLDCHERLPAIAVAWLVELLAQLGETDRGAEVLHRHGFHGSLTDVPERAQLLAARGSLHLAAGRFQQGLDDLTDCGRDLTGWGVHNPAVMPWRSRAALCASALQRNDLAVALAQDELLAAEKWDTPWTRATALHALAVCERDERSLQRLRTAVDLLAAGHAQGERVRVCYDLGVLLEGQRGYDEAHTVLTTACEVARRSGNETWAERVEATAERMTRRDTALSRQEVRIAQLARSGRSNREIADQLHLTVRTVEHHLSGVYRKLRIAGRADLSFAITAM